MSKGILIKGAGTVVMKDARISGFEVGIEAESVGSLDLDRVEISTKEAEVSAIASFFSQLSRDERQHLVQVIRTADKEEAIVPALSTSEYVTKWLRDNGWNISQLAATLFAAFPR